MQFLNSFLLQILIAYQFFCQITNLVNISFVQTEWNLCSYVLSHQLLTFRLLFFICLWPIAVMMIGILFVFGMTNSCVLGRWNILYIISITKSHFFVAFSCIDMTAQVDAYFIESVVVFLGFNKQLFDVRFLFFDLADASLHLLV